MTSLYCSLLLWKENAQLENKWNLLTSRWFLHGYCSNPCTVWTQQPRGYWTSLHPGRCVRPSAHRRTLQGRALAGPGRMQGVLPGLAGKQNWQKTFSFFCSSSKLGPAASVLCAGGFKAFALAQVELLVFTEQQHESKEWRTPNSHCCCLPVASASN